MSPAHSIRVALSTASTWPEPIAVAFQLAAELGYDGVEVMVWADAVSQDITAVAALANRYRMPVLAVHAPCLLISQRVWAADPTVRLQRSVQAATELGAGIVVVHPRFAGNKITPRVSVSRSLRWKPHLGSLSQWKTCSRCGVAG